MLYTMTELRTKLENGEFDQTFDWLYTGAVEPQRNRYLHALDEYQKAFGMSEKIGVLSSPGRTEIGGNHTDHQHGCVVAAAVTMDVLAVVSPTDNQVIRVLSAGYPVCEVHLNDLEPREKEFDSSTALIRGVAAAFKAREYQIGGFTATMSSQVPKGSGLSSSASYEVMIGNILSNLFNEGRVSPVEIAQIGQYAENVYFGKPCGLMDQTASSVGGFVAIDFENPEKPIVKQVEMNLRENGYTICIVNAGGNHADLTHEYAAIPEEMKKVANYFGKAVLREVDETQFFDSIGALRGNFSDRAILRSMHFFSENKRAQQQAEALELGDVKRFLKLVEQSGRSSIDALQNIYPADGSTERSVALAVALSDKLLAGKGVTRVHGGGFAGTIQAFVPNDQIGTYCAQMERVFGNGCCFVVAVRPTGGYML